MFDLVAPDQHKPALRVDRGRIEHHQPRLARLAPLDEQGRVAALQEDEHENKNDEGNTDATDCEDEPGC